MIIWGAKKVHCQLCSDVLPQKLLSKLSVSHWHKSMQPTWTHCEICTGKSFAPCQVLYLEDFYWNKNNSANIQWKMINVTTPLALIKLCVTYPIAIKNKKIFSWNHYSRPVIFKDTHLFIMQLCALERCQHCNIVSHCTEFIITNHLCIVQYNFRLSHYYRVVLRWS